MKSFLRRFGEPGVEKMGKVNLIRRGWLCPGTSHDGPNSNLAAGPLPPYAADCETRGFRPRCAQYGSSWWLACWDVWLRGQAHLYINHLVRDCVTNEVSRSCSADVSPSLRSRIFTAIWAKQAKRAAFVRDWKAVGIFCFSLSQVDSQPCTPLPAPCRNMVYCSQLKRGMNISDLSRSHLRTLHTCYVVSSACCVCVGFDFRRGTFLTLRCFLTSTLLCLVYKFTASLATMKTIPPTKLRPHCS